MRAHIFVRQRASYCIAYTGWILVLFFALLSPGMLLAKEIQYPAISIQLKQVSLSAALLKIQDASHYGVLFHADDVVKYGKPVTLSVKKQPLPKVLDLLFDHQPFTYHITDSYITVAYKSPEPIIPKSEANQVGDTSSITITGHVSSDRGEPLAGATVMVKGTQIGAITDERGNFIIKNVPVSASSVQVHIIGYTTSEIPLTGSRRLAIQLQQATNSLDETVILAYGSTSQRLNTGSISKISSHEIAAQPIGNALFALEGKLPGLYVNQTSGVPGSSANVYLRGVGSITSSAAPLYIIDGIPFTSYNIGSSSLQTSSIVNGGNPLNSINPADIESIEVLKDADATAIYGSRGGNGVILITTKKGTVGKTKVNISAYTGISQVTKFMSLLNTSQYVQMREEAFKNDQLVPNSATAPDLVTWDTTKYTDWQKKLLGGTGHINDLQASVSGGSNYTQFLFNSGYHKETTVFPGNYGDKKGSLFFNLNHLSENQRFKLSLSSSYSDDINDLFYSDLTPYALSLPPDIPNLIDSSGNLVWPQGALSNPYSIQKQKYKAETRNLFASTQLGYELFPFLQIKLQGGFSRMEKDEIQTNPLSSFNPADGKTLANTYSIFGNNSLQTWILEPQLDFTKKIGQGIVAVLIGATFQQDIINGNTLRGTGFSDPSLMESMAAASSLTVQSSNYSLYKYAALFGQLNYNVKNRYVFNFSVRKDDSSRFGPGKQSATFAAAGAAWIFSEENWLKDNLRFLSFGKIRGSYGSTGNDKIGDYKFLSTWLPGSYAYNGVTGLAPSNISVPDYSWEVTRKLEGGISLGFIHDRILLNTSYYRFRSSNQLINYAIAPSTGFTSIIANFPAVVQNKGWEFDLTTQNIQTKNFRWTTAINATIPSNKLLSFPGLSTSSYQYSLLIGQPISIRRVAHVLGVDPATGAYQFQSGKDGSPVAIPSIPGDYVTQINLLPKAYGGIQNTLTYKNLSLGFFFQWVLQDGTDFYPAITPGGISNQPVSVLNHWKMPGDNAEFAKYSTRPAIGTIFQRALSDGYVDDASFIRLKNVQIAYLFEPNLLKRIKIDGCSVYLRGQNLLTITSFNGPDPEQNKNLNALPSLRVITAGIQLTL